MDIYERFKKMLTESESESTEDPVYGLTSSDIISGLMKWRSELVHYLVDKPTEMDMNSLGDCQSCHIGLWLKHAEHSAYESTSEFIHFKQTHLKFHEYSAEIVRLHKQGKSREAKKLLHSGFTKVARELQLSVSVMYEIVKKD